MLLKTSLSLAIKVCVIECVGSGSFHGASLVCCDVISASVGRARITAVAVLVVALEEILDLVGGIQLIVDLPQQVLDRRLVVVEAARDLIEVVVGDRTGQVASLLRGHEVGAELALAGVEEVDDADVDVLVVRRGPEPELVLHDGPAVLDRVDGDLLDRRARQEAVRPGGEELRRHVAGLHAVVLVRGHRRALEHVAAALGHEVDGQAARLHGDVAAAVADLNLLERIEVEVGRRGVRGEVRDRPAFEVPLDVGRRAARVQADLLARGRSADVQAGANARRHADDLPGVAGGGDLLEHVSREDRPGRRFLQVDDRRRARDGHFFRERAELQLGVDAGVEAGFDDDIGTSDFLEAAHLEGDGKLPDRHVRELKRPGSSGDGHERLLQRRSRDRHGNAGQHRAGIVGNLTEDGTYCLGTGRSGPERENTCQEQAPSEATPHHPPLS